MYNVVLNSNLDILGIFLANFIFVFKWEDVFHFSQDWDPILEVFHYPSHYFSHFELNQHICMNKV